MLANDALEAVGRLFAAGKAEHPSLVVDERVFGAHVERHVGGSGADIATAVGALRSGDLYLACACAQGDERAIGVFRESYGADVRRALARVRVAAMDPDDLDQELARRMFVGPGAKIADYSGHGDLRAWARIVATRFALDIARVKKNSAERPTEASAFASLPAASDSPELALFRRHYQQEVKRAIEDAARSLDAEERNALREHYVRGLTVDQIAVVHGIHRATAARRVQRAREALIAAVKATLEQRHGLAGRDLASVMGLVRSQFHLSIDRVLA